jgi:hypothetical protein
MLFFFEAIRTQKDITSTNLIDYSQFFKMANEDSEIIFHINKQKKLSQEYKYQILAFNHHNNHNLQKTK